MKKGLLILAAAMLLSGAAANAADPAIVLTFPEGTASARLGIGFSEGTCSIDWGNGEEEVYESEGYFTKELAGTTVKIYGDNIEQLLASGQKILTADVSNAGSLTMIQLNQNGLTSLVLGEHPNIKGIYASENKLSILNIEGALACLVIDVHSNMLEGTLDCSKMTRLSSLSVYDNKLTGLEVPKGLSTVYEIDCSYNQLETIEVENLAGMVELQCGDNKLTSVSLKGLDGLEDLYLEENQLTSVDLSGCPNLEKIMVADNQIEAIDLSKNPKLTGVYVQNNKLTALDLSENAGVKWLNFSSNNISEIGIEHLTSLNLIDASNNALTEILFPASSYFPNINVANNQLTTVDVSKFMYLSMLDVSGNKLTSLNLEGNPYLYYLYCSDNQIEELDIEINNFLQRIEAQGNKLSHLNLSQQVNLRELLIQNNQFGAEALQEIFTDIPNVSEVEVGDNVVEWMRQLNISYNPGTSAANVAKAEEKGWFVTADYKSTGIAAPAVESTADVVETIYYNAAGVGAATPFKGFNIRVDVLSDGSTRTSKTVVK